MGSIRKLTVVTMIRPHERACCDQRLSTISVVAKSPKNGDSHRTTATAVIPTFLFGAHRDISIWRQQAISLAPRWTNTIRRRCSVAAAPRIPVPSSIRLDGSGTGDASEDTATDPAEVVSLEIVPVESTRISFEIVKELIPGLSAVKSNRTSEPFPEITGRTQE